VVFALVVAAAASGVFSQLNQAQSVDVPATILGLAGLCAAIALAFELRTQPPRTRLGWSWTLFAGWTLLAALMSRRALAAFVGEPTNLLGWWTIASVVAIAWFATVHRKGAVDLLRRASPWLLLVQVAVVVVALLRAFGSPDVIYDLVARGTLPNSTGLGEFALLLLPWALLAPAEKPRSTPAPWRIITATATLAVLAVSRSRIALIIAALWAAWWLLGRCKIAARTRSVAVIALITAAAVGVGVFSAIQVRDPSGGQLGMRPEFTRVAVAAAVASPVVGYGPDGFVAGGASVSTPQFVSAITPLVFMRGATDPHNLLLWVLVSAGFVGLALFIWALTETAVTWSQLARDGDRDVIPGMWAVGGALVVFLTAPASIAVLPLFGFVLGATLPSPASGDERSGRAIGVALLGMLGLAGLLLAANTLTRLPLELADAQRSPALARRAQSAAAVWTFDPYLYYLASLHWGWSAQSDQTLPALKLDLGAIERATALDRRDPFIALEHARTLRYYQAAPAQVDDAFLETLRRWPAYPTTRVEYAEYLLRTGRNAEAREQLAIAEKLTVVGTEFAEQVQGLRDALRAAP
jgi:hypothetical protein